MIKRGKNMSDKLNNSENIVTSGENISVENVNAEASSEKAPHKKSKQKKKGKVFLRVLILVVVFCLVVFAGVILSDVFFGNSSGGAEPEIIVIKVSGQEIILNENNKTTLDELDRYLSELDKNGELSTVALINDTATPADPEVYNNVVRLLQRYGIVCETLPVIVATDDEISTPDQHIAETTNAVGITELQEVTVGA